MDRLPRFGKRELICLLLFTCNYVVSVRRGFLFLWVLWMGYVISSPEPKAHRLAYRIPMVRRPSVVRPSTISNIFSSETAWPIKAKFYVEPPWEGGTKVYINGPGHMTKMAAMPIYGKKTFKNLLLQNHKSYDLETWHVALGTLALQCLCK